ncbi:similar to Saccharomyces cerevisiae YKR090W PXL1 LIM domain-containing protein that localizes to sites of polarized growth [Maudiozyma saulgeensis]|uniref:Similar to Saccharomyces cerevisiae YKR090W PXL1 LIM domain-containing protein that localizes to sites of polarized growth n=1 Tax=Maudiozyma saulgeensis TaxID=1789683 RepID=A0A1X7R9E7_9SACH|nr:similar to Saccharomyces cerevisiae YKR090W PXL1 LIM domain-containing protein that localizes to sites of polarized growth [Kazachstania saulgeensis]
MYSGLYSSPFPKLNPNVRYRTVFERAGFDTNNGNSNSNNNSSSTSDTPPHNHSHQHQHDSSRLGSGANTPTKSIPTNGIPMSTPNTAGQNISRPQPGNNNNFDEYRSVNDRNRISPPHDNSIEMVDSSLHEDPYVVPVVTTTASTKSSSSSRNPHHSQEPFNFETNNTDDVNEDMNPIDRSFMMLTQNDSHSIISQSRKNSNHGINMNNHISRGNSNVDQSITSSHSSTSSHFKRLPSPVQELDLGFKIPTVLVNEPNNNDSNNNNIESLKTDSVNFEPDHILTKQVTDEHSSENNEVQLDFQQEEHASDTIVSKNLQVEQLIAELDDVSFSRNEQISQTLLSGHNGSSSNSDESSSSKTTSVSIEDPRMKKSSAYLSGFPLRSQGSSPPSKDSDNDSFNSGTNPKATGTFDGTPTFFKFASKDKLFSQPDLPEDKDIQQQMPEIKYAPGEGPCRLCGKDILEKGVFSKNENELSGQWHRNCFRCSNCSIKFNKKVPCYILNDKPYCQQHYHEENHSICQVCSRFIEGECLENDNMERFHIDCLKCFICKKIIENDYFIFNDEVPICADHDMDVLIENGLTNADFNDTKANETLKRNNTLSKRRTRVISFMD